MCPVATCALKLYELIERETPQKREESSTRKKQSKKGWSAREGMDVLSVPRLLQNDFVCPISVCDKRCSKFRRESQIDICNARVNSADRTDLYLEICFHCPRSSVFVFNPTVYPKAKTAGSTTNLPDLDHYFI